MRLLPQCVDGWPKLAWVAEVTHGSDQITVYHGPMVEVSDQWVVEAVWAGDFASGDFDRTSLVFGTGIRVRENRVVFVGPGTGVDRLWWCEHSGGYHVSNSLPALLAHAGLSLDDDYEGYAFDIRTVETRGIRSHVSGLPTTGSEVRVIYAANLEYRGHNMRVVEKVDHTPHLDTFEAYRCFLAETAGQLKANCKSPSRRAPFVPLVAISSGYDSPAVAVVAKWAGCTQAVTITRSTSLWRGSDSGEEIAKRLGLACRCYDGHPVSYRHEETVWAASGCAGGLNLTIFDYPEPLCVFFSGSYGDKVWDRFPHDFSEPVGDSDHLLCEFRLLQGVFECVVPWWGIRRAQEVNAIGAQDEMEPWRLNTGYDRPVARRLAEEAGIPRGAFGIRKKNTATNTPFLWPFSPEAQESFRRYLRQRGVYAPSRWEVAFLRTFSKASNLLYQNTLRPLGIRTWYRPWLKFKARDLIFQWANHELKKQYEHGLQDIGRSAQRTQPQHESKS